MNTFRFKVRTLFPLGQYIIVLISAIIVRNALSSLRNPFKGFKSVPIQHSMRIKQAHVSGSVAFFEDHFRSKYNLGPYIDPDQPAIFVGCYRVEDLKRIKHHKSLAIVVWRGSDSMHVEEQLDIFNKPNVRHIAIGKYIADDLRLFKIPFTSIPISHFNHAMDPVKKGPCVYAYINKTNPSFYGQKIIDQLDIPFEIVTTAFDSYSRDEVHELYSRCFIGLRLTPHDGLPNTVLELGLMGIPCVYNGELPGSLKWKTVEDVHAHIMEQSKNIGTTDSELAKQMFNHLQCGDEWLDTETYGFDAPEPAPIPKVSVVMNTFNENPEYLQQAVRSYMTQVGVHVELILSTVEGDPSIKAVNDPRVIKVVNNKPGIYSQLNAGMASATGDWVVYASSNDVADYKKLATEVKACIDSGKEVCYSSFHKTNERLRVTQTLSLPEYNYQRHLKWNFVSDCSLFSKRIKDKYTPFREEFGNSAYHDFWLRVYEGEGDVFVYNPRPTWFYRINNNSRHLVKTKDAAWMEREAKQKQDMIKTHTR